MSAENNVSDQTILPSFLLASLLASYPDEEFGKLVGVLLEDPELDMPGELAAQVRAVMQDGTRVDELRSEYIDLFDRGRHVNPLYETEYGRERALVKGPQLADIAGFYKAFGLELQRAPGSHEMLDHVAIELEFYSLLALKSISLSTSGDAAGSGIVLDARAKFLKDHLGRFAGEIGKRPGVQASPFYGPALAWLGELVSAECARMGVAPDCLAWAGAGENESEIACGGSVGCLK